MFSRHHVLNPDPSPCRFSTDDYAEDATVTENEYQDSYDSYSLEQVSIGNMKE